MEIDRTTDRSVRHLFRATFLPAMHFEPIQIRNPNTKNLKKSTSIDDDDDDGAAAAAPPSTKPKRRHHQQHHSSRHDHTLPTRPPFDLFIKPLILIRSLVDVDVVTIGDDGDDDDDDDDFAMLHNFAFPFIMEVSVRISRGVVWEQVGELIEVVWAVAFEWPIAAAGESGEWCMQR